MTYKNKRQREAGSALVYILIAIALLAALTVTFMEPSSQQTTSQNSFRSAAALQGQIDTIRSSVQECVLRYPNGDQCINGKTPVDHCTTTSTTDPGAREEYPINPDSDHYTNATPGKAGNRLVRNIRCPGNNGGDNADHDNHELIFSGNSGKFMPAAPDLFEEWQWYNGDDGVFFWTRTTNSDSFLLTSLEKLDQKFGACEADIISAGGTAVDLDSNSDVNCPANNICFRVWMIIDDTSAVYPDEAGCP